MSKTLLFYNLFPKTEWKSITKKLLESVPHDAIIVHITVPKSRFFQLLQVKTWLHENYPKVKHIIWSLNKHGLGETVGFNKFRKTIDLSDYSLLTYVHSKGSSRKRKNTPQVKDWTELMRYFVIERLDLALDCFEKGYSFYGVNLQEVSRDDYPKDHWHYSGNFVTVNLNKVLKEFLESPCKKDYYGVEMFWGSLVLVGSAYSPHNSPTNHYEECYPPERYRTIRR